ncbi:MAG: hypothetical protein KDA60_00385 [Planctomycetales bacterium]|nr:hypothetical protein [Planctomycetales bacterium]
MLKKLLYAGSGVVLLSGLLFGRDAVSYVRTSAGYVKDSVKHSVPVEFEIERARKMISSLEPEIRQNKHLIAKEEVSVERLRKQVDKLESRIDKSREDMVRLKTDLERGEDYYYYAGRRYSNDQVKIDLANRLTRQKTNDATLVNLSKVLNARERGLQAARQKLEEMLASKQQLIVAVENLEARQKMVDVAQTSSELAFDDSRLSRTKDLITSIQTRIEVAERLVDAETSYHDEIPLDDHTDEDIVEQVAAYLGGDVPADEIVLSAQ